jgi:hypothetical protein
LIFFNLLNLFWHTDKNFCFYAEVNFWDFVRNDNSNKETRFGPKKKSSPIYLGPKNLDTFWCTGWAWNCQIILRCASIHCRAGFILKLATCDRFYNKNKSLHLLRCLTLVLISFYRVNICLLWQNIECSPLSVTTVNNFFFTSLWPTSTNFFTGIYRCCSSIYIIYL